MATKTTTATNGKATAADVAQSTPAIHVPEALAKRILARIENLAEAQAKQRDAGAALDDMIDLSREMLDVPADYKFVDTPGGGFAWIPPRPAPPPPADAR